MTGVHHARGWAGLASCDEQRLIAKTLGARMRNCSQSRTRRIDADSTCRVASKSRMQSRFAESTQSRTRLDLASCNIQRISHPNKSNKVPPRTKMPQWSPARKRRSREDATSPERERLLLRVETKLRLVEMPILSVDLRRCICLL